MVACLIYSSLVIVPPANHVVRAVLYRVVWGKSLLCKAQVTSYPFQKAAVCLIRMLSNHCEQ